MDKAKLISTWSAAGSPGRTTIALALAAELAELGKNVFLLDADTYAPSIELVLGLVDHPAGLAAACRLVGQERFDLEQLQRLSTRVAVGAGELTVMTGLSSESRWAEVSSEKLDDLLMVAGEHFDYVILDVASPTAEGLQASNSSVDRNAVVRWAIGYSDYVVAICAADPVGVSRFLEAMVRLAELKPTGQVLTLVNRLRSSVLGPSAKQQIIDSLERLGQITVSGFVPDDPVAADSAIRTSLPIGFGRRSSQAKQSIALFCRTQILGQRSKLDVRLAKRANR
jgi:MinD-like ATPase involved in chromosome partitioning or flagellar assembly